MLEGIDNLTPMVKVKLIIECSPHDVLLGYLDVPYQFSKNPLIQMKFAYYFAIQLHAHT